MGMKVFALPDPGEGLTEAEIISWKVAPGDAVAVNQIVVEIETAKSLVELPIPWDGTVGELLVPEGQTVEVGTPIITVQVAGGGDAASGSGAATPSAVAAAGAGEAKREPNLVGYGAIAGSTKRRARKGAAAPAPATAPPPQSPPAQTSPPQTPPPQTSPAHTVVSGERASGRPEVATETVGASPSSARPLAKPPVRKYAKDRGVDLAQVPGSGEGGIISRADIDAFLAGGAATEGRPLTTSAFSTMVPNAQATNGRPVDSGAVGRAPGERETRIPVKGVRKMTADAMVRSKFSAPHVTEFVTLDVTATMDLVERLKKDREFRDVKVTPLLVVAKAIILACRRNPGVNAVWDEAAQEIVIKHYVNLGIAAATPRGLVVPNIKDADAMTMRELADAIGGLVETARAGRTQPADMAGGTITITNVGVFGVDTGTPIINPGESAILAFGAVKRMPWVVMDDVHGSEQVVPRWVTQLALSFDHRLIDGDLGSRFLADIAAILEDPAKGLVWG
ncbi:MAG: 2-oxo acid dehydrogenase subunit E2 [Austwickia sp.]|nr:2-oxo acid dehydrogenase subunit E2 [Austwickia sp.]